MGCEWCGVDLPPPSRGRPRKFCSHSHRQLAYMARRQLTVRDVGDRDGWICHLCEEPVLRERTVPDPLAPTLDHDLPLGRGGGDDPFNARLAHYRCNIRKGGRWLPSGSFRRVDETGEEGRVPAAIDPEAKRCRWCNRPITDQAKTGRPRVYCRTSCRQMDYMARRRAKELGLSETELVVTKAELDQLRDALYVLEAAVEDVERDLADAQDDPVEVRRALDWILEAARPLLELRP